MHIFRVEENCTDFRKSNHIRCKKRTFGEEQHQKTMIIKENITTSCSIGHAIYWVELFQSTNFSQKNRYVYNTKNATSKQIQNQTRLWCTFSSCRHAWSLMTYNISNNNYCWSKKKKLTHTKHTCTSKNDVEIYLFNSKTQ